MRINDLKNSFSPHFDSFRCRAKWMQNVYKSRNLQKVLFSVSKFQFTKAKVWNKANFPGFLDVEGENSQTRTDDPVVTKGGCFVSFPYCIIPLCWVIFCIHSEIIPVGQFSRICAKSINQSSVDFHGLIAWLTVSKFWLDWFIGVVPHDFFYGGGAKVTQCSGIIQYRFSF